MKTFFYTFIFLSAFLANALFGQVVVTPVVSETEFFSVPVEDRSFHVLMQDSGLNLQDLSVGDGDFDASQSPHDNYDWSVGVAATFDISYDISGNLSLVVGSSTLSLEDQPLIQTQKLYIGAKTNSSFEDIGVHLTNLSLNGNSIQDIITSGTNNFNGLEVSGVSFGDPWQLSGTITFVGLELEFAESGAYFYGTSVPEPSVYVLIVGLISLVFCIKKRDL